MDELNDKALEQIPIPKDWKNDCRPRSTNGNKRRENKGPSAVACCPASCAIRLLPPASPSSLVWDITTCDWMNLQILQNKTPIRTQCWHNRRQNAP